jgi:hypothetical protein
MWRPLLLLLLLALAGCKARDGETLRKVVRKSSEKLQNAARPMNDAAPAWCGSLGEPSLAGRVENRIRHDRYLAAHRFAVRAAGPGAVAVSATVPAESVKARALDLARSTLGVENVIDEVKLGPQR